MQSGVTRRFGSSLQEGNIQLHKTAFPYELRCVRACMVPYRSATASNRSGLNVPSVSM